MNVYIFGANGMLGTYVVKYLSYMGISINPITRKDFDITQLHRLEEFLKTLNISDKDVFINCSGIIPQSNQYRNNSKRDYYLVNGLFPVILSYKLHEYGCKMIHITTDCVFDGKKGQYSETDDPTENNDYGVSKSLGDFSNCCVIRTSIIGEESRNKRSLLEWVKSKRNETIDGYDNHLWNGVTCLQLSKIIYTIINKNIYWRGVRHIYSPRTVSKYELVNLINKIYELNIQVNKISKGEYVIDKSLTSNNDMLFDIPDIKTQIEDMKLFIM